MSTLGQLFRVIWSEYDSTLESGHGVCLQC